MKSISKRFLIFLSKMLKVNIHLRVNQELTNLSSLNQSNLLIMINLNQSEFLMCRRLKKRRKYPQLKFKSMKFKPLKRTVLAVEGILAKITIAVKVVSISPVNQAAKVLTPPSTLKNLIQTKRRKRRKRRKLILKSRKKKISLH